VIPVLGGLAAMVAVGLALWTARGGLRLVLRPFSALRRRAIGPGTRRSLPADHVDPADWVYRQDRSRAGRAIRRAASQPKAHEDELLHTGDGATPTWRETPPDPPTAVSIEEAGRVAREMLAAIESLRRRLLDETAHQGELQSADTQRLAEQRASEMLAAAEAARARAEQQAVENRELVAEERRKLSLLLKNLLSEVERSGIAGGTVSRLAEAREARERRTTGA
jgi:hypothetical protein